MKKIKTVVKKIIGKLDGKRVKMTERDWKKAIEDRRKVVFK